MKFVYIKLEAEEHKGKQKIEGVIDLNDRLIVVDDLVFHGTTSRIALENLKQKGYLKAARDLIYIIDRQLQRSDKGPSLEADGYQVHSLMRMEDIIRYMIEHRAITPQQLQDVFHDYLLFDRHDPPDFLQEIYASRDGA